MKGFNTKTRYQVKLMLSVSSLALFYNSPGWSTIFSLIGIAWMIYQNQQTTVNGVNNGFKLLTSTKNLWWFILSISVFVISATLTINLYLKAIISSESYTLISTEQCLLLRQNLLCILIGSIISTVFSEKKDVIMDYYTFGGIHQQQQQQPTTTTTQARTTTTTTTTSTTTWKEEEEQQQGRQQGKQEDSQTTTTTTTTRMLLVDTTDENENENDDSKKQYEDDPITPRRGSGSATRSRKREIENWVHQKTSTRFQENKIIQKKYNKLLMKGSCSSDSSDGDDYDDYDYDDFHHDDDEDYYDEDDQDNDESRDSLSELPHSVHSKSSTSKSSSKGSLSKSSKSSIKQTLQQQQQKSQQQQQQQQSKQSNNILNDKTLPLFMFLIPIVFINVIWVDLKSTGGLIFVVILNLMINSKLTLNDMIKLVQDKMNNIVPTMKKKQ